MCRISESADFLVFFINVCVFVDMSTCDDGCSCKKCSSGSCTCANGCTCGETCTECAKGNCCKMTTTALKTSATSTETHLTKMRAFLNEM